MPSFANPDGSFFQEWGAPPVHVIAPASGDVVAVPASARMLYVRPGAGLAALTIKLPRSPVHGQFLDIGFAQPVTALTIQDGNGAAVPNAPGAGAAGAAVEMVFVVPGPGVAGSWVKWR